MSSQKEEKLKDYIEQIRGISYKKDNISETPNEGYIPLLKANNIKNGEVDLTEVIYVDSKLVQNKQLLRKGDILVAASSGSKSIVGKSAQINNDLKNVTFGAFCKVVRPNEHINSYYVGHYFSSPKYRHIIENVINGSNINNLKNEHIDNLNIPIPEMEIQDKVVLTLDEINKIISLRNKQLVELSNLKKSIFYDMFGSILSENHISKKDTLRDYVKSKPINGHFAKKNQYTSDGNAKIVWISDFVNREFVNTEEIKTVEVNENIINKYRIEYGDLLFVRSSLNKEGIGKCAYVPKHKNDNLIFEDHIIKISIGDDLIPEFLQSLSETNFFRNQIIQNANTSTMTTINQKSLLKCNIIVPPIEEQKEYVNKVRDINDKLIQLEKSIGMYHDLFYSLMQKAFQGDLFQV